MRRHRRADAIRSRERILAAAERLLNQSPTATIGDIAAAAGTSRTTVYRHFADRRNLVAEVSDGQSSQAPVDGSTPFAAGRLGRAHPVALDAIHVLDAVPPAQLPEQLVAEASLIAEVPVALYVLDIDGTHLLRIAGPAGLPRLIEAPLAIGPELDADGLRHLCRQVADPAIHVVPLWLRGRAVGVMFAFGRPARPLLDMARQAAAAVTLADRYTDVFARSQRRKRPSAAAEIQQSLLPPRIVRIPGGEVAGNVLPSYEVAGDWFDVVENADGLWITIADGLGDSTRAAASSAVALGALRASRRSGADITEALVAMHQTLREMPGARQEMTALGVHWDTSTRRLRMVNCGHVPPTIIRRDGGVEKVHFPRGRGLGGRAGPSPVERTSMLDRGDRLVMVSDGVLGSGADQVGLGLDALVEAALRATSRSAPSTVREIHAAVLRASPSALRDDATVVCLSLHSSPGGTR